MAREIIGHLSMNYSDLLASIPSPGRLVWIGLRETKDASMVNVDRVIASPEIGLHGDRYCGRSGTRQVTLIQHEHLAVIEALITRKVNPEMLRRNLVIAGINLLALKNTRFRIGEVVLETTGLCHPCSKMERMLGPGGFHAMRGHGGLTARVIDGGTMQDGDAVLPLRSESPVRN
jgi:MOSC domain-containing protein YiiM